MPQLHTLYNNSFGGKPKVSYYEGLKEIVSLYEQSIGSNQIDAIDSGVQIEKYAGKQLKEIFAKIITKNTQIRELIPQNDPLVNYHKLYIKPYHQYIKTLLIPFLIFLNMILLTP